jgi:hypothetical protein
MKRVGGGVLRLFVAAWIPAPTGAQLRSNFDGMWSDPPATAEGGRSVGRFDGQALVIETSGIAANRAPWQAEHSDQLRVVERYTRSQDGAQLLLTATMEDPWSLREPLVLKKIWTWAPTAEIAPYNDCERPTEFSPTGNRP